MQKRKYLQSVLWAALMGFVTVILCLLVAERYLGITGFVSNVTYFPTGEIQWYVHDRWEFGRWFRWLCLIVIPLLFAKKVQWYHTWINLLIYFLMYFPIFEFVGEWPAMFYLADNSGFFRIPQFVNGIFMAIHFWSVEALVLSVYPRMRELFRPSKNAM